MIEVRMRRDQKRECGDFLRRYALKSGDQDDR